MLRFIFLFVYIFTFPHTSSGMVDYDPEMTDASLHIKVKNIRHDEGKIYIAIFNATESFMKDRYVEDAVPVNSSDSLKIELKLPYGTYAVTVFHDINDNEKLNTNFLGIPKEPYGFSNNPKITFGPPNFEEASFELLDNHREIEIVLK